MRKSVKAIDFRAFYVMERIMCDLLKKSALAYRALSVYEYTLICGRKGIQTRVVVRFPINAYHHLAGFQYARLAALKEQKSALSIVLSDDVTYSQLIASGFQHSDRLECILNLQKHLESNHFVFRYRGHEHSYSHIRADYLMLMEDTVFFIEEDVPVSIFKNSTTNYQRNCPRLTVLQICRANLETGEKVITYQREGFTESPGFADECPRQP